MLAKVYQWELLVRVVETMYHFEWHSDKDATDEHITYAIPECVFISKINHYDRALVLHRMLSAKLVEGARERGSHIETHVRSMHRDVHDRIHTGYETLHHTRRHTLLLTTDNHSATPWESKRVQRHLIIDVCVCVCVCVCV